MQRRNMLLRTSRKALEMGFKAGGVADSPVGCTMSVNQIRFCEQVREMWKRMSRTAGLREFVAAGLGVTDGTGRSTELLPGVPGSRFEDPHYRLRLDTKEMGAAMALVASEEPIAIGCANLDDVSEVLKQMVRLHNVLIRYDVAHGVAQSTGVDRSKVLALYRCEGNLGVLPSAESVLSGMPGNISAERTLTGVTMRGTMVTFDATSGYYAGKDFTSVLPQLKEHALAVYFVQIGGLDVVGGMQYPRASAFAEWSARNWMASEGVDSAATKPLGSRTRPETLQDWRAWTRSRWNYLLDTMIPIEHKPAGGKTIEYWVTPRDPAWTVRMILEEAVLHKRRLSGDAAPDETGDELLPQMGAKQLPEALTYLRYNAGDEAFIRVLGSALLAASKAKGERYAALRAAMPQEFTNTISSQVPKFNTNYRRLKGLTQQMETLKGKGKDYASLEKSCQKLGATCGTQLGAIRDEIDNWLAADTANPNLLADFVHTAGTGDWKYWVGTKREGAAYGPRPNLSRYMTQLEDYEKALGRATGGATGQPGSKDSVPALLEPGERVFSPSEYARNKPLIESANRRMPRFGTPDTGFAQQLTGRDLGGRVVPGTGTGDSFPATLEPGGFVLNRNAAAALDMAGLETLERKLGGLADRRDMAHMNELMGKLVARTRGKSPKVKHLRVGGNGTCRMM